MPRTAHFVAEYAMAPNWPSRPATELMLMIEPPLPAWTMALPAARMPRNTPVWLTATIWFHCSIVSCTRRASRKMPALLTRMSRRPWVPMISLITPSHSSSDVTSRWRYCPPSSWAVSLPGPSSTSASTTLAPSEANRRPSAAPWPRAPPVMSATFPANELPCAIASAPFTWSPRRPYAAGSDRGENDGTGDWDVRRGARAPSPHEGLHRQRRDQGRARAEPGVRGGVPPRHRAADGALRRRRGAGGRRVARVARAGRVSQPAHHRRAGRPQGRGQGPGGVGARPSGRGRGGGPAVHGLRVPERDHRAVRVRPGRGRVGQHAGLDHAAP